MRDDVPSLTARAVALARGVASLPGGRRAPAPDPLAARLLDPLLGRALDGLAPIAAFTPAVSWALRLASLGLVDHLALRTAAIDAALRAACARDVPQVVLLGAGLDARAFRVPELAGRRVLEVDHPATQRFKRRRVEGLTPFASELRFVSVDFTREDLGVRLAEEGHDTTRATFWIWEGVVPYLPEEVTRATLATLAARSAAGSGLAVTYGTRDDALWLARLGAPVHLAFRALGEPLHGLTTVERMQGLLAATGWHVEHDSGPADWRRRFGYGRLLTIEERLAVATKA
ncbi:MAG: SAM-dependent methyltransferase [Sandaracinaceae bacterium]|nr:SAM-dependent methyltransferase [Sandaracinaceae bacterium]